jgi:hypothetical protein
MTNKNIYLLTPNNGGGYDTYNDAVVIAANEAEARLITPLLSPFKVNGSWASSPDKVKVALIGKALKGAVSGMVTASFSAG